MNKYIPTDKLIAEIERMREINRKAFEAEHIESGVFHGRAQAINHLFEFIIHLQQEQPEVDLGREIIRYKVPFSDDMEYLNETTLDAIAYHFYELGLNSRKEETK